MDSAVSASSAAAPAPAPAPTRGRCIVRLRLPRAWTAEEDALLERLAKEHGFAHWHRVARRMPGRSRSARSCRDRWRHHLARDVYHRPFTVRDDEELRRLVGRFGSDGRWKDIGRAVYGRTSRVMKRRWKELRKAAAAAAGKAKSMGGRRNCCPPALPSDDDQELEDISDQSGETAALQLDPSRYYADDVLASSFASCSLAMGAVDPRAGSLALGFACMAV
ncbi:hypothetical protein ACP70R_026692 [Stipagrostis hirtigluma subsp. patula]